ncbi:ModD protein [Roseospira visakhapatnamensis]|uniref:Putative pyrophosphorylase ModD n=1 Tax=Roseospira visakhapatnamensis TaxID=390880 RepID=A0A7W6WB55_9PROT|nr:ModD protein [Roseospira visakhapatnamensis]MBB4267167.1 molybdenum transport protein [Roseospira visakhapatnamensis]
MIVLDDATLLGFLREDAPYGDLTTRALAPADRRATMTFAARDALCLCGVEEAARLLTLIGAEARPACASGAALEPGAPILEATGTAEALLMGWKVAQTLMEWASGVATAARALTRAAHAVDPDVAVACTRKAVPGARALSAKAVLAGGAGLHRTGLSDTVLLFPEHRAVLADDGEAPLVTLDRQIRALRRACPERTVVVEVKTPGEALAAADHGADVLQLEKFSPDQVAALVARLPAGSPARVAAAGGVTPDNAAAYVRAGARVLVTSWPYTARPADVAVTLAADRS